MDTDKILYYTDGHRVTITEYGIKVKNTLYRLEGITRHGLAIIYPTRIPFVIIVIAGIFLFAFGAFDFIPKTFGRYVEVAGISVMTNVLLMAGGILLLIAGLLFIVKLKEKYAVKIATAEGDKNVVVSSSREYITQILDGLNRAYFDLLNPTTKHWQKIAVKKESNETK